jgi:capsular polysaccharide biosynthesis protein
VAGYAAATQQPHATARLDVSRASAADVHDLSSGSTFMKEVARSYADLASTPFVLQPVIEELGLHETAEELAEDVSTRIPDDTVVIEVTVTDDSGERAATIANAIAQRLVDVVPGLTPQGGGAGPEIRLTLVRTARAGS